MPARLPSAATLPLRWSPGDAQAVLAAFQSSGLSEREFSLRTGIQRQRLRRWQAHLATPPAGVRLLEVVPRMSVAPETVEVVSPGGWVVRVPAALLGDVLRTLSEGPC